MSNQLPIRVLVAGGSETDRESVKTALDTRQFAVVSRPAASDLDAGVAVPDAIVQVASTGPAAVAGGAGAAPERVPMLTVTAEDATGLQGAGRKERARSGNLPFTRISELPTVIEEVVGDARTSVAASADTATRALRESYRLIAIGKLAAEIAHEVNNPLEAVTNLLYLAIHEPGVKGQALEYLRDAERELKRVVQISKQTLSFSRENSQPTKIKVSSLADEVIGLYRRRLEFKRLSLVRDYKSEGAVYAFPGELRQVISNLVTNAIDALPDHGSLHVRIRSVASNAGAPVAGVRVTIADNGQGISAQVRKRIGEIFFSTKGESGTGLGLWVTSSIVERYGGNVKVRSSVVEGKRRGTTFSVFIPVRRTPLQEVDFLKDVEHHAQIAKVTEISEHPRHATNSGRAANIRATAPAYRTKLQG